MSVFCRICERYYDEVIHLLKEKGDLLDTDELPRTISCPNCFDAHKSCICSFCENKYFPLIIKDLNSFKENLGWNCCGYFTLIADKKEIHPNEINVNYKNKNEVLDIYVPNSSKLLLGFFSGSIFKDFVYEYNILKEVQDLSTKLSTEREVLIVICDNCVKKYSTQYLIKNVLITIKILFYKE